MIYNDNEPFSKLFRCVLDEESNHISDRSKLGLETVFDNIWEKNKQKNL